ncbi:hypothetical protein [Sandarakinorhabdus sp.]|uniref:hypothetical protein n=1 Tax=Sandarakinorhabdus sp. TaxID=1916663 RepID=UPI00286D861B|nr:hypothetical protein [Sandarakinorhabdus sp.]
MTARSGAIAALLACAPLLLAAAPPAPAIDAGALAATGPARRCLPETTVKGYRIVGGGKWLMVQGIGRRWWRSPLAACRLPVRSYIIERRNSVGQMCRQDPFYLVDPFTRADLTYCNMGDFTPVAVSSPPA